MMKKFFALLFLFFSSISIYAQIPPFNPDNKEILRFDYALELSYVPDWRIAWYDDGVDTNGDGAADYNYDGFGMPSDHVTFYAQMEVYFTFFNFIVISGSWRDYFMIGDSEIINFGFTPVLDHYSVGLSIYLTPNIIIGIYHYCFHPVIVTSNIVAYKKLMGFTGYEGSQTWIYLRIQSY